MTTVHVMIGIPGSGKTSIVKEKMMRTFHDIHLSSDAIRIELDEPDNVEVFAEMNKRLQEKIKNPGKTENIYYDATNVNRKRRRALYRNIKNWDKDVNVNAFFISVPYTTALNRNLGRAESEVVPPEAVLRMHRTLQIPRVGVDCDNIEFSGIPIFKDNDLLHTKDISRSVSEEWMTEIMMSDTPHDCEPWHLEDVFTHIDMAVDNSPTEELSTIALFHDLGKGITKNKDDSGYATYRGHPHVSAHYYLNYLAYSIGEEVNERDMDIAEVIHQHMNFHNKLGKKNIENNRLNDAVIMMGHRFAEIDSISKITKSKEK